MRPTRFCNLSILAIGTMALCLVNPTAAQQVPVVDAQGAQTGQRDSSRQSSGGANADLVYELYSRLDQLQQEMQTLRGMVEEQGYRIRQMEQEQRDRYLDLDQRVSELTRSGAGAVAGQGAAGGNLYPPGMVPMNDDIANELAEQSPAGGNGATGQRTEAGAGGNAQQLASTPENEQQIYRSALNMLLEESRYEDAIRGFQRYLDSYPDGRYFTNALYWQGEALILEGRYAEAEIAFSRIVENYPDDPKAAGALLKMGVAYQQSGQIGQARQAWQSLRDRYPDSLTEIRAAEDYLSRLPSP